MRFDQAEYDLRCEWGLAGRRLKEAEDASDIGVLDIVSVMGRVAAQHLARCRWAPFLQSAIEAQREGRALTQEESAVIETWNAEWTRLSCLAGLCAPDGTDLQKEGTP